MLKRRAELRTSFGPLLHLVSVTKSAGAVWLLLAALSVDPISQIVCKVSWQRHVVCFCIILIVVFIDQDVPRCPLVMRQTFPFSPQRVAVQHRLSSGLRSGRTRRRRGCSSAHIAT